MHLATALMLTADMEEAMESAVESTKQLNKDNKAEVRRGES